MRRVRTCGLFLCGIVFFGCAEQGTTDLDFARAQIVLVGRCLARLSYDDVYQPQSLAQLLDRVEKKGIGSSKKKHLSDYWQNAYLLQHHASDDVVTIRILSKGENGLFEKGNGDDLTCEINIAKNGTSTASHTYKGRTEKLLPPK